jgi:hypothetical protein
MNCHGPCAPASTKRRSLILQGVLDGVSKKEARVRHPTRAAVAFSPAGRLTFGRDKSRLIQSHSLIVRATLEFRQPLLVGDSQ